MLGDTYIFDSLSRKRAKEMYNIITGKGILCNDIIILIGGISGSRKTESAVELASMLIKVDCESLIISLDDFYSQLWHKRNRWRKQNLDILKDNILNEMDMDRINWTIKTFKDDSFADVEHTRMSKFSKARERCYTSKEHIDCLIIEGLYACNFDGDIKFHLGGTDPEETLTFRKKRNKENERDTFRKEIVKLECNKIKELIKNADYIL